MYILNIPSAIKKMSVNEIRDFIFENYYKRILFSNENRYYLMKKTTICSCLQLNEQKRYLILLMLKNTISHL